MNSRSSVNESNLVTFSPDLSSLNSLDKEQLLTFPFDHIYACHSQNSDSGHSPTLDKNVEISTHCLVQSDKTIQEKDAEILALRTQNKRLKELLVYHLDLIQQQNDTITNREKTVVQAGNVLAKRDKTGPKVIPGPKGKPGPKDKPGPKVKPAPKDKPGPKVKPAPKTKPALKRKGTVREIECVSQQIQVREKVEKQAVKSTVPQKVVNPPPPSHDPTTSSVALASDSLDLTLSNPTLHGMFNTFAELLGPDNSKSSFIFNSDTSIEGPKPFEHEISFDLDSTDALSELPEFPIPAILDNSQLTPLQPDFIMIERPIPVAQNEPKAPEPQPREPKYTITTNSGMPIIKKARNRKKTSNLGSLSRMPKRPKPEPSTIYDNEIYNVNKKPAKTLNTYGKPSSTTPIKNRQGRQSGSRQSRTRQSSGKQINSSPLPGYPFSGSLSDRLRLIDTTPTGEDPYQIGEAEMREQSPIPRLVLPNRVRVHTAELADPATTTTVATSRRVYDPEPEIAEPPAASRPKKSKKVSKVKTNRRKSANAQISTATTSSVKSTTAKSQKVKKEDLDWEPYTKKPKLATSLNDFSYGETALKLSAPSGELVTSKKLPSATLIPNSKLDLYTSCNLDKMQDISKMSYNEIFDTEQPEDESVDVVEPSLEAETVETVEVVEPPIPTKKGGACTTSLAGSSTAGEEANADIQRGTESKRGGRKRALSAASSTKREKAPPKPRPGGRGRGGYRGKRGSGVPVPSLTTRSPYHTALGHPDISWYLGHDPDVKKEDVEQLADNTSSNVEVPRWREMTFTSMAKLEGTENTEDEVYRKRHQKLEAEERRQLRWHMRRVREQRHVEKLRLRQRDPWTVSTLHNPPAYSVWPSPLRDLQLIEITDIIPVLAFGEDIPLLPEHNFVLPWVRTSKAQKRTKRSKTLH